MFKARRSVVSSVEDAALDSKIDYSAMMEMVNRREQAAKSLTPCPKCETMQVQLVDWRRAQLKYKCRHCKHVWAKESPI
jgi:ribosomal protein L37AE/L43A